MVESARIELASPGCRPGALPLSYDPAGCEGIEPSLRVLEARPVTMTLQPVGVFAARRGVEPLSHRRRRHCDTGRITGRSAKQGGGRGSNPPPQVHGLPSSTRRVPPPRSDESPRPESNRIFPLTGRALVHTSLEGVPRLQRKESNLRVNRLTAGCLTIRLRWKTWTEGHGTDPWPSVVRRRVVNERCPPDGGPISFGGRDRTCIAGSRGQRPAFRRPRSADTRSLCRRGSARADLRLDWAKES